MKKSRIGILMLTLVFVLLISAKTPAWASETLNEQLRNLAVTYEGMEDEEIFYAKTSKYTIKFNGNKATSGKMSALKSCKYGKSYKLKANAFKRKGYTFTGWNTKANSSGKTYKNKASVKNLTSKNGKTVTLYAQWKKTKYAITYVLNGGKNNKSNPSKYYVTSSTIKLKNPTRKGYTFKGWYSDSKYKNKVTSIKKGSTGNKKFYAKWQKVTEKAKDITLTVWCPDNQIKSGLMTAQQQEFAKAHPEWDITWNTYIVGDDVAKNEILKDIEAAADVFFYSNDQLPELVEAGAIAKLGGKTKDMVMKTMAETAVNSVKLGDALYGIPYKQNTFFMYYDRSILTEKDVESLDKIIAKETSDYVYNFLFDSGAGWKTGAWYYGAGLTVFGEQGDDLAAGCDWNSEKGVAVTKYLIDMINNDKVEVGSYAYELVRNHQVGAWFDGSWNYMSYKEMLGEALGIAPLPTYGLNGKQVQLKGFYGSQAIGVNAKSKNLDVAIAFAEFLGTEEQQLLRYEKIGTIPTNIKAGKSEAVQSDPVAAVLVEEANNCSVVQPTSRLFNSRFWTHAGYIDSDIKGGRLTNENAQEYMDKWVSSLCAE